MMKNNLLLKLISLRIKAMVRNMGKNFPASRKFKGAAVLLGALLLYLVVACEVLFIMLGMNLAPLCTVGLTWLYFALFGVIALFMTVFMTAFMTRNQMYNASDNDLLLSMPISRGTILLSRVAVLLGMSFLTVMMLIAPAVGVYIYCFGGLTVGQIVGVIASVISVTLTAQALSCLFGYILHRILMKVKNQAVGSAVFVILFLGVYFTVYAKVGDAIAYLMTHGEETAAWIKAWAAPVYSLGLACSGELLHSLIIAAGSAVIFGLVYLFLSRTFLRSVHGSRGGEVRKAPVKEKSYRRCSPSDAVFRKELRRLLTSSVYLTNTGVGVLLILAAAVGSPFIRTKIETTVAMLPGASDFLPLVIPALFCFLCGTACFTASSVSLEGKSLWVMRSMPVSGRDVLLGKLKLHVVLTGTSSVISAAVLSVVFGCGAVDTVLIVLLAAEIAVIFGMLGLIFNLLLPNFSWTNEVAPVKQGLPVLFVMLTGMGLPVLLGLVYYLLADILSPTVFLALLAVLFPMGIVILYRRIVGWGGKRFESFSC